MAEGYVFNGTTPVRMSTQNTFRWNGTAWVPCENLHALVGGSYLDILEHPKATLKVGDTFAINIPAGLVSNALYGRYLGFRIGDLLRAQGYASPDCVQAGQRFRITYRRNATGAYDGTWFQLSMYGDGVYFALSNYVYANAFFEFTVAGGRVEEYLTVAWSAAGDSAGGGNARNIEVVPSLVEVV